MRITLDPGAIKPTRAHPTDAGLDLYTREEVVIPPMGAAIFDTGVHFEMPKSFCGKIVSKSGLNFDHDIICGDGTVDEGYTGSVRVKLYNLSHTTAHRFVRGAKIAQMVLTPCFYASVEVVDEISQDTARGADGFGSTGA